MKVYSGMMEMTVMPSVAHTAMTVDGIAMKEMTSGPSSLQKRSIRRILAFNTVTPCQPYDAWKTWLSRRG